MNRVSSARFLSTCNLILLIVAALLTVLVVKVRSQDVPPNDCPPTYPKPCCAPATTSTSQTWPQGASVHVNIDPSFSAGHRAAIVQSFQNWQAAGNSLNNGSQITFSFTYNSTAPSMTPPPGSYNLQVWNQNPPRDPSLGVIMR
jgi:hypothetical protein